jgi:DNA-binding MarR family transcriptional regulator
MQDAGGVNSMDVNIENEHDAVNSDSTNEGEIDYSEHTNSVFSNSMIGTLVKLHRIDMTCSFIAEEMKLTTNQVTNKINKLQIAGVLNYRKSNVDRVARKRKKERASKAEKGLKKISTSIAKSSEGISTEHKEMLIEILYKII